MLKTGRLKRLPLSAFVPLALLSLLPACTPAAVGAGASVGMTAAQEGGIPGAVTDLSIQTQINNLWFQHSVEIFRKLDLTVKQGRVLITGVVQNPQDRVDAVRLAWQAKGVKQVINEIRIAESEGLPGYARDTWVSGELRARMIFNKYVQSINYSIDTVQGVVFLMGVAQNQMELNRVIDIARGISGVKQVVSYVKFAGQPLTEAEMQKRVDSDAANSGGTVAMPQGTTYINEAPYNNTEGYVAPQESTYTGAYDSSTGVGRAEVQGTPLPPASSAY